MQQRVAIAEKTAADATQAATEATEAKQAAEALAEKAEQATAALRKEVDAAKKEYNYSMLVRQKKLDEASSTPLPLFLVILILANEQSCFLAVLFSS